MTSHERFTRMFNHQEADRIPVIDSIWTATIERWQSEGMPKDVDVHDYFGMDHLTYLGADITPRFEVKTLEETDEYIIQTTPWGVTAKNWKHAASTPLFIEHTIKDADSWSLAKQRMTPTDDRIDWKFLETNYPLWKKRGDWLAAAFWFGFDVSHAQVVGTERFLLAMVEDPEWCMDLFNHSLDMNIALFDRLWEAGYTFDSIYWWDDMGYKNKPFFSLGMYRELLKPTPSARD